MAKANNTHFGPTPFQGKSPEKMNEERRLKKAAQKHRGGDGRSKSPRAQDGTRNPRGFRGKHIVSGQPLVIAAMGRDFKGIAKKPKPQITPLEEFVNRLNEALANAAKLHGWSDKDIASARSYAVSLVFDQGSAPDDMKVRMRRAVEWRFAVTVWFMRRRLEASATTLPGMQQDFFAATYKEAQKRFPA